MNAPPPPAARARWIDPVSAAVLLLALWIVYQPALSAGFVWDDSGHVTRPDLRGFDGLVKLWTDAAAAQQYYPLLHTSFWLQFRVFGEEPAGYHWVNLFLHAGAALLLVRLLQRLAVPGAWFAGALWALHPLQVESVAWISEQKNTLSACFYFGAWLAWLRFDDGLARGARRWGAWALFALLALAATLSKTVTCTLVPAILVVTWWREGGRGWVQRVPWLVLPFLVSAAFAVLTPWLEGTVGGAGGAQHPTDLPDYLPRLAVAGKDLLFYLWKLAWPFGTSFVHPRWDAHDPLPASLLPLAGFAVLVLLGIVLARRGQRGPLAALLFFAGTLSPALGFLDAIPFRYSFVADHFQYLAGLGPIVLAAAGGVLLARRIPPGGAAALLFAGFALLGIFARTARDHAKDFKDAETLWKSTLERNPGAWMAWENLVDELNRQGRHEDAIAEAEKGLRLHPDRPGLAQNLGVALQGRGRLDEALRCYEFAVERAPENPKAHFDRGSVLIAMGRHEEALRSLDRALAIAPELAAAHMLRANALLALSRSDEALPEYEKALALAPEFPQCWYNLGVARAARKEYALAEKAYRKALELAPDELGARLNLGVVLAQLGRRLEGKLELERVAREGRGQDVGERAQRALGMLDAANAPPKPPPDPAPTPAEPPK